MDFKTMQQTVFAAKPGLKAVVDRYGQRSVGSYAKAALPAPIALPVERAAEVADVFGREVSRLFGPSVAELAIQELCADWLVSTAEHHGPLSHPFVISGTVTQAFRKRQTGGRTVVVFSCADVSLNNSSFPRGLTFHTPSLSEERLAFQPWKFHQHPVFGSSGFTELDEARILKQTKQLPARVQDFFVRALPSLRPWQYYADQVSVFNELFWRELPGQGQTHLLYITQESIVNQLLIKFHLTSETFIHQLLFAPAWQQSFVKNFAGLTGAWSPGRGTCFFWALQDGKRLGLLLENGELVSRDGSYRLLLTPTAVGDAIGRGELIPSMALSYIVLSFYYGLVCGGGFSQVNYLPELQAAYLKILREQGHSDPVAEQVMTNYLSADYAFLSLEQGSRSVLATGLDILLYPEQFTVERLQTKVKTYPLSKALDNLMPEFYAIIVGRKNAQLLSDFSAMTQCYYCGNNPVPHFLTRVNVNSVVVMTPFNQWLLRSRVGQFFNWLTEVILFSILHFFRLIGFVQFYNDKQKCTIIRARALWDDAEERGIPMEGATFLGKQIDFYRAKINGKLMYFNGLPRPKSSDTSSLLWMDDKAILKERLLAAGLPVARGGSFSDYETLVTKFRELEKPVIVKPRLGSRGRHTSTFIYTEAQLQKAFEVAKELCRWVVMEEHLVGSVYRGTMINGKLRGVLGGSPPRITGDGRHTIAELVQSQNERKPVGVKDITITPFTLEFLARHGYTMDTVLPDGKLIDLSHTIGVSYGGASFEITDETHPDIKEALERAAAVVNDPLLGFDFIIEDVTKSPAEQKWGIIECNGIPFINLHHYPLLGKPNNVARYVWDLVV